MSDGEGPHLRMSEALGGGARVTGGAETAIGLGLMLVAVLAGVVMAAIICVGVVLLLLRLALWPMGWSSRWVAGQSLARTARMYERAGAKRLAYELHSMASETLRDKEAVVSFKAVRRERARARKLVKGGSR